MPRPSTRPPRRKSTCNKPAVSERPNTIGLRGQLLIDVLNGLDSGEQDGMHPRRQFSRLPFRVVSLKVQIQKTPGTMIDLKLACRNLSSGGVGLLHSAYVHTGTRVLIELPMDDEGVVAVRGEVVRCNHIEGTVHEVGVRFDTPIDIREFVRPDPASNWFSIEAFDESKLEGTVIHATTSNRVRSRLRNALTQSRLKIRNAETINEVVSFAAAGASIIISDWNIEGGDAEALCKRLQRVGIQVRVIVLGPQIDDHVREALKDGNIAGFVKLPIEKDVLIRAIAEFGIEPETVELDRDGSDDGAVQHATATEGFASRAAAFATDLTTGLAGDSPDDIRATCEQIAALAVVSGHTTVAKRAEGIAEALTSDSTLAPVVPEVASLLSDCLSIVNGGDDSSDGEAKSDEPAEAA